MTQEIQDDIRANAEAIKKEKALVRESVENCMNLKPDSTFEKACKDVGAGAHSFKLEFAKQCADYAVDHIKHAPPQIVKKMINTFFNTIQALYDDEFSYGMFKLNDNLNYLHDKNKSILIETILKDFVNELKEKNEDVSGKINIVSNIIILRQDFMKQFNDEIDSNKETINNKEVKKNRKRLD